MKDEIEEFYTVRDLKRILGVSPGVVIGFVQRGLLPAYRFYGPPIDHRSVTTETQGLRFYPADVRELMQQKILN